MMGDMQAVRAAAERIVVRHKSDVVTTYSDMLHANEDMRRMVDDLEVAETLLDLTDPTPADAKWLDIVYQPRDDGWNRFQVYKNGSCYFCSRDTASTFIGLFVTRGRVRAFALAMGLELTEGEG